MDKELADWISGLRVEELQMREDLLREWIIQLHDHIAFKTKPLVQTQPATRLEWN